MKLRFGLLGALVALSAIVCFDCGTASAQRGGGGGFGGGPGGGFGGMGGMMGGMGGMMGGGLGGNPLFSLLGMEEVRTELNLEPDQTETLTELAKEMRDAMPDFRSALGDMFRGGGEGGRPDRETMQKKMEELMAEAKPAIEAATKKATEGLADTLDPDQFERLLGLVVQQMGVRAVATVPQVQEAIEVSDAQVEKMKAATEEAMESVREAMAEARDGGFANMREKMEELGKQGEEKLNAILTSEQKESLENLKGEKFEFPEPRGGRGGRGGPGAGGADGGPGQGGGRGGRGGRGGGNGGNDAY